MECEIISKIDPHSKERPVAIRGVRALQVCDKRLSVSCPDDIGGCPCGIEIRCVIGLPLDDVADGRSLAANVVAHHGFRESANIQNLAAGFGVGSTKALQSGLLVRVEFAREEVDDVIGIGVAVVKFFDRLARTGIGLLWTGERGEIVFCNA
jgi:hypothetical protein